MHDWKLDCASHCTKPTYKIHRIYFFFLNEQLCIESSSMVQAYRHLYLTPLVCLHIAVAISVPGCSGDNGQTYYIFFRGMNLKVSA